MTGTTRTGPPRAIVFDFDGVLADTERLHMLAFQRTFASRDWTLDERTYFDRYLGYDDVELIARYAHDQGYELDAPDQVRLLREKAAGYAAMVTEGSALFAGAAGIIRTMSARFRLAIASGSLREEIVRILGTGSLQPFFPVIVGADDVRRTKPAPDPYIEAVRRLGVAPAMAVAVEDSRWGLASARAAGLRTIGVTTSYPADALPGAEIVIPSIDALTPALVDDLIERPAAASR